MLKDHLKKYVGAGFSEYTELRAQANTTRRVTLLNGNMINNDSSESAGFSARVRVNGAYGFSSGSDYTPDSIERIIAAARENAVFLDSRERMGKPPFAKVPPMSSPLRYTTEDTASQKRLIEFVSELDAYIAAKYPKLLSRVVIANCLDMEKLLVTSDDVHSHSDIPRSHVMVQMTLMGNDGTPVDLFTPFGGMGVFDDQFTTPDALYAKLDALYEKVAAKAEGVYAEPGYKEVILHSDLAGILAHEAVGHTVEADFVLSGSVAGPSFGKQVASEKVTLVDFANTAFGRTCPQPVYVDDEGTPAEDAVIIKDGILSGYMHNKESAEKLGFKPQGNARAFLFSDEPLIRMRNTCILPGKDKLEDMIASIDDGYYFIDTGNGQADATGEFMFGVNFGYEIKNGKIARPLRDTTIAGVAFEVLKTVDMLSDELTWGSSGMCGKKQPMPVGMGGPAVKLKINVGGR